MAPPVVRDVSLELGRGGIDPGGSVLQEAWVGCYTGPHLDPCSVVARYGPTASYGSTSPPTPVGGQHRVPITVTPGTPLHFSLRATSSPGGEITDSQDFAFTPTPGALVAGPTISVAPAAGTITATGATITWTTATAQPKGTVQYGLRPDALTSSAAETPGADATAHSRALTGLTTVTRYYYRVVQPGNAPSPGPTVSPLATFVTI